MRHIERSVEGVPISELSFRSHGVAGELLDEPRVSNPRAMSYQSELVFLIHGFNVPLEAGRRAYREFHKNLSKDTSRNMVWVFWPGDGHKWFPISGAMYSWMPGRAEDCALNLKTYIERKLLPISAKPLKVYIIAHSLGCRVTLELMRLLTPPPHGLEVKYIALMAAAVPVYMIERKKKLDLVRFKAKRTHIVFSRKDRVLQFLFRPGQRGESSDYTSMIFGRRALGRKGLPDSFPGSYPITQAEKQLGHGDYWSDSSIARDLSSNLPRADRRIEPTRGTIGRTVSPIATEGRQGSFERVVG